MEHATGTMIAFVTNFSHPKRKRVNQKVPLKMLAINDVAYPMHVWRNFMDVFESSASENTIQGGDGVEQNTISDTTTLREASEKCTMNASTCSFGLLDRYLDAMQRCLVKGAIQLRRPSGSTAPDVEEMILTLVDLVDMDADHRATMSSSEFCSIFSLLHASVLPIVPQVTHQKKDKNTMTIHTDEEEIKGNVQRCPYFRPQVLQAELLMRQPSMLGGNG